MNKSLVAVAVAIALAAAVPQAQAQSAGATASGGSGGAGGSATGGAAAGGSATNSNTTSGVSNATSGSSSASGGNSSATGGNSTANGGTSTATGGNVGTVSTGGSNAQLGDVTVNYNVPTSPMGKDGLGVGVDAATGHIVTDNNNNINYSGGYKLKNTPDVSLGGPASGPCNGFSGGVGLGLPGMSLGANMSTVDKGCEARETARIAAMLGRMDIANAVLENIGIVAEALKAKSARETSERQRAAAEAPQRFVAPAVQPQPAQVSAQPVVVQQPAAAPVQVPATPPPPPAQTAPAKLAPPPTGTPIASTEQEQKEREAKLQEQRLAAQQALIRQATMNKVNDTLHFTDATTQAKEKTEQQIMAEQAMAQRNAQLASEEKARQDKLLAEENARKQKQLAEENARRQAAEAEMAKRAEQLAQQRADVVAYENARKQAQLEAQAKAVREAEMAAEQAERTKAVAEEARKQAAEELARRHAAEAADATAPREASQQNAKRPDAKSMPDAPKQAPAPGIREARNATAAAPASSPAETQSPAGPQDRVVDPGKDPKEVPPEPQGPAKRPPPPIIDARNARDVLNFSREPEAAQVMASAVPSVRTTHNNEKRTVAKNETKQESPEVLRTRALRALGLEEKNDKEVAPDPMMAAAKGGLSPVAYQIP
ncbi:MAG TPA: hypothetical protein VFC24_10805 [Casimicrobiaceae bacterium]|nr:hypothetical protein [Casimicrobiaceae bacterium]